MVVVKAILSSVHMSVCSYFRVHVLVHVPLCRHVNKDICPGHSPTAHPSPAVSTGSQQALPPRPCKHVSVELKAIWWQEHTAEERRMGGIPPQAPPFLCSGSLRCVKMPTVCGGFWGQGEGQGAETNPRSVRLPPSAPVLGRKGGHCAGRGPEHGQLLPPPPAAGSSAQQPGHPPSAVCSNELTLRCWHKPAFPLPLAGLSFQGPIVMLNGLTTCLPVTFPPLLAALEDSLNPSDLQGRACGGRNGPGARGPASPSGL